MPLKGKWLIFYNVHNEPDKHLKLYASVIHTFIEKKQKSWISLNLQITLKS